MVNSWVMIVVKTRLFRVESSQRYVLFGMPLYEVKTRLFRVERKV